MDEKPTRVILVDDHQVLRDGLKMLLEEETDIIVAGEASNGQEALQLLEQGPVDVVVMDLGMPGMSGFQLIEAIRARELPCRIVVLSMHSEREVVTQAIQAGVEGFVPKSTAHSDLLDAIRAVREGKNYLHPSAAGAVFNELQDRRNKSLLLEELSERERDVIRLTALGYTSREIGDRLSISHKTVETYRQRAMEKLSLNRRSEMVRFALRSGLLDESGSSD
jgi:two-component system response regulator NreC